MFSKKELCKNLIQIGLKNGDIVNVKASLKSVGNMENGAQTLIDALLEVVGPNGTIVTDSFVNTYPMWGVKYWANKVDSLTPSYAGVLANVMITNKGCYRSAHPVQKFAIIGRMASQWSQNHDADSYAYDVLRNASIKPLRY